MATGRCFDRFFLLLLLFFFHQFASRQRFLLNSYSACILAKAALVLRSDSMLESMPEHPPLHIDLTSKTNYGISQNLIKVSAVATC